MMRSYSSAVRPSSRARSRVAFGSAPVTQLPRRAGYARSALEEGAVLDEAAEERVEQREPIRASHRRLRRTLGMRHEAEDVAVFAHDAGDVVDGAVGVGGVG